MSEAEILREALTYGTPIESAADSHSGATFQGSRDPDASGRVVGGRTLPVNLTNRLCAKEHHRGWEWWGDDGRLLCGLCRPPANVNARWLRHGGPIGAVTDLGPTNAAVAEPENDESPPPEPQKRHRRGAVGVGQGSLLG